PWFHTLAELNGYCSSDDQLLIHEEFCKTHAEYMGTFITNAPRGPMAWSFKSLYTSILMNIYRDLDWKSRRMMLGRLLFLGEPADEFISETQSLRVKFVDFETAKNQLLRQWLMPLDLPES